MNINDGSCNPCPINTFSTYAGAKDCQTCYGGSITHSTGAKNYWDCGRRLQFNCDLHPFYSYWIIHNAFQLKMTFRAYLFLWQHFWHLNTVQKWIIVLVFIHQQSCMNLFSIFYLVCPAGQGRTKTYQDCSPCPPGSYNDGSVTTEPQLCIMCPEGFTSSEAGATDCTEILNK